jgi:hypothetical protein
MPVLPAALSLALAGYALKLATQTPWAYELQPESKPLVCQGSDFAKKKF